MRDLAALPPGIGLDDLGTVTSLEKDGKFVIAEAMAERPIPTLFEDALGHLEASGHSILSRDNEGFEAEIFFADAAGRSGLIQIRKTDCPDRFLVRLTFG